MTVGEARREVKVNQMIPIGERRQLLLGLLKSNRLLQLLVQRLLILRRLLRLKRRYGLHGAPLKGSMRHTGLSFTLVVL